jgi:hypothetical protein
VVSRWFFAGGSTVALKPSDFHRESVAPQVQVPVNPQHLASADHFDATPYLTFGNGYLHNAESSFHRDWHGIP